MKLNCQCISATEAGDEIFQILCRESADQDDGPYVLLQRAFFEEDEGDDSPCYVETHDETLIGHYPDLSVELNRGLLILKLPPPKSETIEITFHATVQEFQDVERMLKIIVQ